MKAAWLLAALAVIGSGCDNGGAGEREKAAIRAVAGTKQGALAHQFPATPTSVRCRLNMGGPYPGIRIPGTCATTVDMYSDGSAVVRFTETWDSHDFVVNQRARGKLMHTWDFTVTKGGRISSTRDYGDMYSVP
jgi:hypothetical protein